MHTKKRKDGDSSSIPANRFPQPSVESEPRLVAAGEHSTGFVTLDDLGRPCWSWMDELAPAPDDKNAQDVLDALFADTLSLADEADRTSPRGARKDQGYDPYDTARIKVGNRFKRR